MKCACFQPLVRKLASNACGLFVEVEAAGFERHLNTVLPILEHQLNPDKYEQVHLLIIRPTRQDNQVTFTVFYFTVSSVHV